jgi:hypothetical protein
LENFIIEDSESGKLRELLDSDMEDEQNMLENALARIGIRKFLK